MIEGANFQFVKVNLPVQENKVYLIILYGLLSSKVFNKTLLIFFHPTFLVLLQHQPCIYIRKDFHLHVLHFTSLFISNSPHKLPSPRVYSLARAIALKMMIINNAKSACNVYKNRVILLFKVISNENKLL